MFTFFYAQGPVKCSTQTDVDKMHTTDDETMVAANDPIAGENAGIHPKDGIHPEDGSNEDEILIVDEDSSCAENFKCEFCPMIFKKRLGNANHVNRVHDKALVRNILKFYFLQKLKMGSNYSGDQNNGLHLIGPSFPH